MAFLRYFLFLALLVVMGVQQADGFLCLLRVCRFVRPGGNTIYITRATPQPVNPPTVTVTQPGQTVTATQPGQTVTATQPGQTVTATQPGQTMTATATMTVTPPTATVTQTPTDTLTQTPTWTYVQDFINVACGRTATSSSGLANLAVDCQINTCMETTLQSNPWVQVDLGQSYTVSRVRVWSQGDLTGLQVEVGGQICPTPNVSTLQTRGFVDAFCQGLVGQTVRVSLPGITRVLNVCEIEVDGQVSTGGGGGITPTPTVTVTQGPGTITVTLVDQNGSPLSNLVVYLLSPDGRVVSTGTTDSNGVVIFTAPPGEYIVFPQFPTDLRPTFPNDRFPVTIVSGPNQSITHVFEIPSQANGIVTIRIVDSNGNPIPGVTLNIYDLAGNLVQTVVTNANGVAQVSLPAGTYTLRPSIPGISDQLLFNFVVLPGGSQTLEFVIPTAPVPTQAQTGTIAGSIYNDANFNGVVDAGEGVANVPVFLYVNGVLVRQAVTGSNGYYAFTDLPAGTYTVQIGNIPGIGISEEARTRIVQLSPGSTVIFNIQLINYVTTTLPTQPTPTQTATRLGTIIVRVFIDANWNEVYEANELLLPNIPIALLNANENFVATDRTSASGVVVFENVPMGTYTVLADLSSLEEVDVDAAEGVVSLTRAGERFSVDFAIQPFPDSGFQAAGIDGSLIPVR